MTLACGGFDCRSGVNDVQPLFKQIEVEVFADKVGREGSGASRVKKGATSNCAASSCAGTVRIGVHRVGIGRVGGVTFGVWPAEVEAAGGGAIIDFFPKILSHIIDVKAAGASLHIYGMGLRTPDL